MGAMAINLVKFLRINDLEILNQSIHELTAINEQDQALIVKIITEWKAEQAIANLLFYPRLIPESLRYEALFKALCDESAPYYSLAAIVGLQTLNSSTINKAMRAKLALQLMEIIKHDSDILASRASISVWELLDDYSFPLYLKMYPVLSSSANSNILALVFDKLTSLKVREFSKQLKKYKLAWLTRYRYVKQFKKYKKAQAKGVDAILFAPVYDAIPNLADVDQHPDQLGDMATQLG